MNKMASREPIDKRQLWTLLKISLKTDLRASSSRVGGERRSGLALPPILLLVLMYGILSAFLSAAVIKTDDVFLGNFIVITVQMVFMAVTILLEFSNLILSPEDFPILSPHPVNSRTFFVAKLLHMMIYVMLLAVLLGLAPAVVTAVHFKQPLLFVPSFLGCWAAATATAFFFAVFYTVMLRLTNRDRMHRYLSYLQLIMIFMLFGGYNFLPGLFRKIILLMKSGINLTYLYMTPPGWFASWAELAHGSFSASQIWATAAGLIVLVTLYFLAVNKLSFGYAKTLNDIVEQQQDRGESRNRSGLFERLLSTFSTPEDRVVWRLMQKQFKYDNRYKMSLLMIFPLTVLYLYLGLKDGKTFVDPFVPAGGLSVESASFLVYMALSFVPFMVVTNSSYSASWQASWLFYASPANRTRLVNATNRFALIFFCLPYLLFLCAILAYFFGNILHAILHCIVLYLFLLALVGATSLILPRLPFALPQKSGQRAGAMMAAMLVPTTILIVAMTILSHTGYGGVIGYSTIVIALILASLLMSYLQRRFTPRRMAKLEFLES